MTETIKNGWTARIKELEEENRRLSAALKKGENAELIRAEMDWAPVWDAQVDLTRLTGIIGAMIYLIRSEDGDDEKEDILTALVALQEKISECAEGLDGALKGMKLNKKAA